MTPYLHRADAPLIPCAARFDLDVLVVDARRGDVREVQGGLG